jgi:murein DD-endopeptidase MepM/ murein hydrolase activator NlpD
MPLTPALLVAAVLAGAAGKEEPAKPLFATVDLDRNESREVRLPGGATAKVRLLGVEETRDSLRSALRQARVRVEINGRPVTLTSGNYRLPVTVAGVQVDCPATRGLYPNHDRFEDSWGLDRDARLRLWPERSAWVRPGTFVYPVRQRWFAGPTQIGNEPSYVDGGDRPPAGRPIYYHSGNDIGGCEGMVDVVSACDGLVVSARGKAMPGHEKAPFYKPRGDYDYVYVLDAHGWYYRYAHLKSIDEAVRPGERVKAGQKIGVLGKEGSSGGWAHLHFDIKAKQPSGKWGIQDAYPFLWEAYRREHSPQLVAVARPHHLVAAGEKVTLDGSRSWSAAGKVARYQWTFHDGSTAEGATAERVYKRPGSYSEVLKVTDARGRIDYDFAVVQVIDRAQKEKFPPTIHAAYAPTFGVRAGDPVTFKVRTFRAEVGNETWDFGDGTAKVLVRSDGNARPHDPRGYAETVHRFARAGLYVVRVEGTGHGGMKATAHLAVRVAEKAPGPGPARPGTAPGTPTWPTARRAPGPDYSCSQVREHVRSLITPEGCQCLPGRARGQLCTPAPSGGPIGGWAPAHRGSTPSPPRRD